MLIIVIDEKVTIYLGCKDPIYSELVIYDRKIYNDLSFSVVKQILKT